MKVRWRVYLGSIMDHLKPCSSKWSCPFPTMPYQWHWHHWSFIEMWLSGPTSNLLNQNLYFNKVPRRTVGTFKFEKHWSNTLLYRAASYLEQYRVFLKKNGWVKWKDKKKERLMLAGRHGCTPGPETNKSNMIYLKDSWALKQNFRG